MIMLILGSESCGTWVVHSSRQWSSRLTGMRAKCRGAGPTSQREEGLSGGRRMDQMTLTVFPGKTGWETGHRH